MGRESDKVYGYRLVLARPVFGRLRLSTTVALNYLALLRGSGIDGRWLDGDAARLTM